MRPSPHLIILISGIKSLLEQLLQELSLSRRRLQPADKPTQINNDKSAFLRCAAPYKAFQTCLPVFFNKLSRGRFCPRLFMVCPTGIEPAHIRSERNALSTELRTDDLMPGPPGGTSAGLQRRVSQKLPGEKPRRGGQRLS